MEVFYFGYFMIVMEGKGIILNKERGFEELIDVVTINIGRWCACLA